MIGWASAPLVIVVAALGVWLSTMDGDGLDHIVVGTDAMEPAIRAGSRIAYDRHAYDAGGPEVGDVVVFRATPSALRTCSDSAGHRLFVERVIGVSGDRVSVRQGAVDINGVTFEGADQRAADYAIQWPPVPPGRLIVVGDNLPGSCDSHLWRPDPFVPVEDVVGRVRVR